MKYLKDDLVPRIERFKSEMYVLIDEHKEVKEVVRAFDQSMC